MNPRFERTLGFRGGSFALVVLAAGLAIIGCRGDTEPQTKESSGAATPAAPSPVAPVPGAPASRPSTPGAAAPAAFPVTDAIAFRDRLLELARATKFDPQADASSNLYAIRRAWQKQYPSLKFAIFHSVAANPSTVSAGDAFLTARANYDRLFSFAVADAQGRCAGGVAVIPGDNEKHRVSDEKVPTMFKAVEMSGAKPCTGEAVGDMYQP